MKQLLIATIFILSVCQWTMTPIIYGQSTTNFLMPADTFDSKRFTIAAIGGGITYSAFSYGLYQTWYKDQGLTSFHFYDDLGEWRNMDKAGHLYTGYFESLLTYKGAKWTGMEDRQAAWLGFGLGLFFQTTVEVMDGFAEKWGFSWADMSFNVMGSSAFLAQQLTWQEQRIAFKVSSSKRNYEDRLLAASNGMGVSSVHRRVDDLYGTTLVERYLKDYNAQSIWASVNIASFIQGEHNFPKWLNVAVGYGADNLFGGFDNRWEEDGNIFQINESRYTQFFLSPDIDLTRIPVKSGFLRTILQLLNLFKIPAPTLEFNTNGQTKWHWVYY